MKIKTLLLAVLLGLFCGLFAPRQAMAGVTFSYFYESLAPYGDWLDVDQYGYCWQPRGVDADWRPYTDGYWSYTDAGWTWVSYEDFGAIAYHYGRWVRLDEIGWVWKPDFEWGPAWVSWRQSDDYIGWAPLPPDADFDDNTGIGVWVDRDYDIGPSAYVFCETRYFGAPVVRNYLLPWRRNVTIINSTVNITNITVIDGRGRDRLIFNGGPDYRRIAPRGDFHIEMLRLRRERDGDWLRHPRPEFSRREGGELRIIAPEIERPRERFAPAKVSRQVAAPHVDRGWSGIADPRDRDRVKARYNEQTQGLTRATAPAKPVAAAQVQTLITETQQQQPRQRPEGQPGGRPGRPFATPQTAAQTPAPASVPQAVSRSTPQTATPGVTPQERPQRNFTGGVRPQPSATPVPNATLRALPQATPQAAPTAVAPAATPQERPQRPQRDLPGRVSPQATPATVAPAATPQERPQRFQREAAPQAVSTPQERPQRIQREAAPQAVSTPREQPQRIQREAPPRVVNTPREQPQRIQREAPVQRTEPSRERQQPQVQQRPSAPAATPTPTPGDDRRRRGPGQN